MTLIEMKRFGLILTGREFGKTSLDIVVHGQSAPFEMDFSDVLALGSSFGEEFIPILAVAQNRRISVRNVSAPIRNVLRDIAKAYDVEIAIVE